MVSLLTMNQLNLIFRTTLLFLGSIVLAFIMSMILYFGGAKIFMINLAVGFGFMLIWIACWLNDKDKLDSSKVILFILIYIGVSMAGTSYYLAYIGRNEIAESLSKAALVELVAPAVVLLLKSLVENLSKYNTWPDKSCPTKDKFPPI
jgi:hypothetical protein